MAKGEPKHPVSETTTGVRLPATVKAELRGRADQNERSLGAEIRLAIRLYLDQAA